MKSPLYSIRHLARTTFQDVRRYHVQALMTAMVAESGTVGVKKKNKEGEFKSFQALTIHQERALLRGLFNFAEKVWYWPQPGGNPASNLKMPEIDNKRSRVLTNA